MTEPTTPQESAMVSQTTDEMVQKHIPGETDVIKQETKELIDAIKKLAQSEMQSAGEFTRDSYLKAVRSARETIERIRIIDPQRIEESSKILEKETEQNWQSVVKEVSDFGDRFVNAAKAAWEVLTSPKPESKSHGDDQPKS